LSLTFVPARDVTSRGLEWNSQVVVDATNDWAADDLQGRTSSELVADLVPGASVVKAGNTTWRRRARLGSARGRRPACDLRLRRRRRVKAHVVALFQHAGFAAIDLGDLATGGAMQEIHHPLAGVNLIRLGGA